MADQVKLIDSHLLQRRWTNGEPQTPSCPCRWGLAGVFQNGIKQRVMPSNFRIEGPSRSTNTISLLKRHLGIDSSGGLLYWEDGAAPYWKRKAQLEPWSKNPDSGGLEPIGRLPANTLALRGSLPSPVTLKWWCPCFKLVPDRICLSSHSQVGGQLVGVSFLLLLCGSSLGWSSACQQAQFLPSHFAGSHCKSSCLLDTGDCNDLSCINLFYCVLILIGLLLFLCTVDTC